MRYLEQTILHEGGGKVAAIILEPVFASGGVIVPPDGFMRRLREICDRYGALLILDEVVTGFGQTGLMFAAEHSGVTPDILVAGKGLTGGYIPGSAVLMRREIGEKIDNLTLHGHTHSNYPVMCRAALKNIEIIIRDKLVENAAKTGVYLRRKLEALKDKYSVIGDVRGLGLLQGFELTHGGNGREADHLLGRRIFSEMLRGGLVTELESRNNLQNSVIVLHPPLIASESDVDGAVEIMDRSLEVCLKNA